MTAVQQEINELIGSFPEDDAEKVLSYAVFLKYLQKTEDEEDRRAILQRKDEPTVPFDEVKKELGLA